MESSRWTHCVYEREDLPSPEMVAAIERGRSALRAVAASFPKRKLARFRPLPLVRLAGEVGR